MNTVRSGCDSDVRPSLSGQLDDEDDCVEPEDPASGGTASSGPCALALTTLSASCGTLALSASAWSAATDRCSLLGRSAGCRRRRWRSTTSLGLHALRVGDIGDRLAVASSLEEILRLDADLVRRHLEHPGATARPWSRPSSLAVRVSAPFRDWITAFSWSWLMVPFCTRPSSAFLTFAARPPRFAGGDVRRRARGSGLCTGRQHGADGERAGAEGGDDGD